MRAPESKMVPRLSIVDPQHEAYLQKLHENPKIAFRNRTRYVILTISIICLAWLMGNSLILNFTIICMLDDHSNVGFDNTTDGNTTIVQHQQGGGARYSYSNKDIGLLFSAIAIGSLVGTYPIVLLETKLSHRNLLTLVGLLSAISTLLIPLAASVGFWLLFIMRFLEGFALAANYPVLGAIVTNWSPIAESGMYTAWLSCNLQFGAMFTMPVSGQFCVSNFGWEGVYYVQGFLTVVSFVIFFLLYRDTPRIHGFVSAKELRLIEAGKGKIQEKRVQPVPYGPIFKSLPIWGVWVCCIGGSLGYQIFVQYGPTYLNKAMNFEVTDTGFLTAVANLASCVVKILGGPLSDMAKCVSTKNRVKLFTIISQGVMALSFVCLALVPSSMALLAEVAYVAAVAFSGLMWVGAVKSGSLVQGWSSLQLEVFIGQSSVLLWTTVSWSLQVSQQHAHFILAIISFINSGTILVLPVFVEAMAPDNTPAQWSLILFIICGVVIACTSLFAFVGEAEPAWWTKQEYQRRVHDMGSSSFSDSRGTIN